MKAIVIDKSSGPEALQTRDQPLPNPKKDEVVIQVYAVGVNELDIRRTYGNFPLEEHWSHIPGLECSGTIIQVGAQVHNWEVGQKVCALLNGGGYADAVAVPAAQVLPYFSTMLPFSNVACLPQAVCLAWESLRVGKLSSGMSIMVYSTCGVICEMVVQIAKMVKATVIVASRDGKWSLVDKPDYIIDSKRSNFRKLVSEAIPTGVDIVLDSGISNFVSNVRYLKEGGTIVYVGTVGEGKGNLPFCHLTPKNATLVVIDRRLWTLEYTAGVVEGVKNGVWSYIEQGQIADPTPKLLPLSNVMEAHQFFEEDDFNTVVLLNDTISSTQ